MSDGQQLVWNHKPRNWNHCVWGSVEWGWVEFELEHSTLPRSDETFIWLNIFSKWHHSISFVFIFKLCPNFDNLPFQPRLKYDVGYCSSCSCSSTKSSQTWWVDDFDKHNLHSKEVNCTILKIHKCKVRMYCQCHWQLTSSLKIKLVQCPFKTCCL